MPGLGAMATVGDAPQNDGVAREGMDAWDRGKDNRLRALRMKRERGDELAPEEEEEYAALDKVNQRFLAAGEAFQRGEGLATTDTLMVLLGFAVGVGNMWRFPYLCAKHGGLPFLFAYTVSLLAVARPLYLLELVWGQDMRRSTIAAYRHIHPRWVGVAYGFVLSLCVVQSYYGMFVAYSLVYIANSLVSPLPWSDAALWTGNSSSVPLGMNSAEFFWHNDVLGDYGSTPFFGAVRWQLAVPMLISYILVFFIVWRGVQATAKVAYLTVCAPVALLVIMQIWSATLDGAGEGMRYFFTMRWSSLYMPGLWADACAQTLFSLIFLPGSTLTLASHMQPKEDVYAIHRKVAAGNMLMSVLCGFTVFCILGYTARQSCLDTGATESYKCRSVDDVAQASGAGLSFVALAEGIAAIGGAGSNAFAFFFFFMCLLLGLDTVFVGVEVLICYVSDHCKLVGRDLPHHLVAAGCCSVMFLVGLIFCTRGGFALLENIDHYVCTYVMLIGQFLQCLMLRLDWTWDRVATQLQLSTIGRPGFPRGREVSPKIGFCLNWVAPTLCILLAVGLFIDDIVEPFGNRQGRSYSAGHAVMSWCLVLIIFGAMPLGWYLEKRRISAAAARPPLEMALVGDMPRHDSPGSPSVGYGLMDSGIQQGTSPPVDAETVEHAI